MHIEPTTRCTLACPGCPRTEIVNKLGKFPKQDLDLDNLVNFLDCASGRELKNLNLENLDNNTSKPKPKAENW